MSRTTVLAALTVSLAGSLALSATAEAGGGLRLGFGGPMASFVATPTHGGSGGSPGYARHCAPKRSQPQQVATVHHAEPRVAESRPVARPEPKVARQAKVKVASAQRDTTKPAAASDTDTSASETSGANASLALAQTDMAASTAATTPVPVTTAVTEPAVAATPVAAVEPAAAPVETAATPEVKTDVKTAEVAVPEVKALEVKEIVPSEKVGCKKFIASVGVTIDVGCAK